MNPDHFLLALKNQFDPETWPWLLAALRQDELIWECLTEKGLGARLVAENPFGDSLGDPQTWSPAALTLFDLRQPQLLKLLPQASAPALPHALRSLARRSLSEWENAPARTRLPGRLGEAGLLALGLRERRLELPWIQVWEGVPEAALHFLPSTSLACLYGLIPDPLEMLSSFQLFAGPADPEQIPAEPGLRPRMAAACLLAQPFPPARLVELALELVGRLLSQGSSREHDRGWELSAAFLLALQQRSPELARQVGEKLPETWTASAQQADREYMELAHMDRQAVMQGLRGDRSASHALLEKSLASARRLQAGFAARLALSAAEQGDLQTALRAWRDTLRAAPDSSLAAGSLALVLLDAGRDEEAQAWLSAHPSALPQAHPAGRLAEAFLLWKKGQGEQARSLGLELAQTHEQNEGQTLAERLTTAQLVRLGRLLLDLDQPAPAEKVLKQALRQTPHHLPGLEYLAQACLAQGNASQALGPALLASSRLPASSDTRGLLVESLEQLEQWPAALAERLAQLEGSQTLGASLPADLKGAAHCALQAHQPQNALRLAQQAAALEPHDGSAQALLGQAQADLGNDGAALEHFRQATRLSPDTGAHWIALARAYEAVGQPAHMLETLRSAALALPAAADIQLALGQALLEHETQTTALVHLRRAWELAPEGSPLALETALPLGKTLFTLGHLAEARRVLQTGYSIAGPLPEPELAYAFGRSLLALDEPDAALPVLETALTGGTAPACAYLDMARAALALTQPADGWESLDWNEQPESEMMSQRALPALQQALTLDPGLHEARALLAEAQAANGDLISAAESFRRALDTPLAAEPSWRARLSSGLGRVSLALGRYETAVAALDEAAQSAPHSATLRRFLAEAMLAAGLEDNALAAAREAREAEPNRLETLVWFADLAQRIPTRSSETSTKARQEALQALVRAVDIAPQRGDLWIHLALAQENAGDLGAARASLLRLSTLIKSGQSPAEFSLSPADLMAAGKALRRLREPAAAAVLFEQLHPPTAPVEGQAPAAASPPPAQAWAEIAGARQESGNRDGALQAYENGLAHDPHSITLRLAYAGLLADLDRSEDAQAGLQLALENLAQRSDINENTRRTQRKEIHLQLARLLRKQERLAQALKHAEAAANLEAHISSNVASWEAHALAASLARSLLLDDQARKWADAVLNPALVYPGPTARGSEIQLGSGDGIAVSNSAANGDASPAAESSPVIASVAFTARQYHCACLAAETALDAGDAATATSYLEMAQHIQPEGRRAQAARARWARQNGGWHEGRRQLAGLLARPINSEPTDPNDPAQPALSIGSAALELGDWDTAARLLGQAVRAAPSDPHARLLFTRQLVQAAEAHRLAGRLDRTGHAPDDTAVGPDAAAEFADQIEILLRLAASSVEPSAGPAGEGTALVIGGPLLGAAQRWQRRGQAAFHPSPETVSALAGSAASSGPDDAAAVIMALGETNQLDAAVEASQAYPNHPEALLALALALEAAQPRQALGAAHRLVDLLETQLTGDLLVYGDAHYLLARLAYRAGARASDELAARASIQTAIEAIPDEPNWLALGAQIFMDDEPFAAGDLDFALRCLEEALSLDPSNVEYALNLGQAYLRRSDPTNAERVLSGIVELHPENGELWLALAQAQHLAGSVEAGVSADRAIELLPDPTPALLLRGDLALENNNARGAHSRAQAALRIHPENTRALRMLAHALQAMERPAEALSVLEQAIPLVEDALPLRLERVRLLRMAQGSQAALNALRSLVEEFPNEARVLSALASSLWETGQAEQAVGTARQALLAGGGDLPPDEQGSLHAALGRSLRREGQLDAAVHHLSEAVRCCPNNLEYFLELGQAHVDRRQHTQALKIFRQAITLQHNDPRPYYQAGLALKESKDYLGAENMLRRAAALAPSDLSIHRQLGAVVALNLVHNRAGG